MNNETSSILTIAETLLSRRKESNPEITADDIQQAVNGALTALGCQLEDLDRQRVVHQLEYNHSFTNGRTAVIKAPDDETRHVPWYRDRKAELAEQAEGMLFWKHYRSHLLRQKGWPQAAVDIIDETTDRVLDLIEDPRRKGPWDRRGMVVGLVQSGKTASYSGLISKAADCGYRLIVIMAGQTNNLRSQTQLRIDEAFIGVDTRMRAEVDQNQAARKVGVGVLDSSHPQVRYLTDAQEAGDFKRSIAMHRGTSLHDETPLVLVVKKNVSILRNLANWLAQIGADGGAGARHSITAAPILLIDDEADHSSINTKAAPQRRDAADRPIDDEDDPTAINRWIRRLLIMFDKSIYVGYTATPFANIFIDDESDHATYGPDLYPRDFIVRLPQPSSYIGPVEVFGLDERVNDHDEEPGLDIIRHVDDHDGHIPDGHKNGHDVKSIPESMITAIKAFVLVCAARLAREAKGGFSSTPHNSMLIHVTRFNSVQAQIADLAKDLFMDLRNRALYGESAGGRDNISDLRELWEIEFASRQEEIAQAAGDDQVVPVSWEEVRAQLSRAVARTDVRTINGQAGEVLAYQDNPQGINVIAIGGDKLSRGLTLEGLSISYYLRASRMYDTLLQMGRWFGYRVGYIDLCRLYTTPVLTSWFQHIALANQELHDEFDRMADEGKSPKEFSYKVRAHPAGMNLLQVTAGNKRRFAQRIEISYGNSLAETFALPKPKADRDANIDLLNRLVDQMGEPLQRRTRGPELQWKAVSHTHIVDFLSEVKTSRMVPRANGAVLADYIRSKVEQDDELVQWHVAVYGGGEGQMIVLGSAGHRVACVRRQSDKGRVLPHSFLLNKFRLIGSDHERLDLPDDVVARAREQTLKVWRERGGRGRQPRVANPLELRRQRDPRCGLLLIYLVDPKGVETAHVDDDTPYLGFAVSFPDSTTNRKTTYEVDRKWWQLEYGFDPNEDEGDDAA